MHITAEAMKLVAATGGACVVTSVGCFLAGWLGRGRTEKRIREDYRSLLSIGLSAPLQVGERASSAPPRTAAEPGSARTGAASRAATPWVDGLGQDAAEVLDDETLDLVEDAELVEEGWLEREVPFSPQARSSGLERLQEKTLEELELLDAARERERGHTKVVDVTSYLAEIRAAQKLAEYNAEDADRFVQHALQEKQHRGGEPEALKQTEAFEYRDLIEEIRAQWQRELEETVHG
jgi:hypothetical protein